MQPEQEADDDSDDDKQQLTKHSCSDGNTRTQSEQHYAPFNAAFKNQSHQHSIILTDRQIDKNKDPTCANHSSTCMLLLLLLTDLLQFAVDICCSDEITLVGQLMLLTLSNVAVVAAAVVVVIALVLTAGRVACRCWQD